MPIPDFQSLMLPVLLYASTKDEHSLREAVDYLKKEFNITPEESRVMIPHGSQPVFYNRVSWARSYLKQAGLLASTTRRNYLRITDRGRTVLQENPTSIDMKYLERFPEYLEFRERTRSADMEQGGEGNITLSPEEELNLAYNKIREGLAREILENIINNSPAFFEKLVVDLLIKMGYGGAGSNSGRTVGRVGDEGIDGVIDEDKLGLDSIYIQAKKWSDTPVGRPEIQRFVGALQGQRAKRGIFFTASFFSDQAMRYAENVETRVVLINGQKLAELMIEYNVGVSTITNYEVKKLDTDYFIETD